MKRLVSRIALSFALLGLVGHVALANEDPDKLVPLVDFKPNKGPKHMIGGHAYIMVGNESAELPRQVAVVAANQGVENNSAALEGLAYSQNVSHKLTWGLLGTHASVTIHAAKPELAIAFHSMPGVPVADYIPVLLRLSPYKNLGRILSDTDWHVQGQQTFVGGSMPKTTFSFKDNVVATTTYLRVQGEAEMTVDNPLPPGDYAIVLRPKDPNSLVADAQKSYQVMVAGSAIATTQPWQYAWAFTVKY